jgi:hypothetical protein
MDEFAPNRVKLAPNKVKQRFFPVMFLNLRQRAEVLKAWTSNIHKERQHSLMHRKDYRTSDALEARDDSGWRIPFPLS